MPRKKKKDLPKTNYWDNCPPMVTTEQVCDRMLEKAKDKENPYFDFRNDYEKGNILYYVFCNNKTQTVELQEITVNTVYPRFVVGYVEKGSSVIIDYNDRDHLFTIPKDADKCFEKERKKYKKVVDISTDE